jgi:hypothetical protein
MRRWRELLAGVVLATLGVLFPLALLEVGVRVLHLVPDRFWEADPSRGTRLIPGKEGYWTQEDREFVTPVQINMHGLRDVEHSFEKPAGVFRILVLGDSFVEAMQVPLMATFPRQLEDLLDTTPRPQRIEVISAGVSGYGTAGALLMFREMGLRYQPDLVLLAFYPGNDVKNNSPRLEDTLRPEYGPDGELTRVVSLKKDTKVKGWRGLLAQSRAYQFLRQFLLLRQPKLAAMLVRLGVLKGEAVRTAAAPGGVPLDYGVYAAHLEPDWQDAWAHTVKLLGELQQEVTAAGATFVLAILSSRDQVYPETWREILEANPSMQGKTWDVEAPHKWAQQWCVDRQAACLSYGPIFKMQAQAVQEPLHFRHDGHWTVAGHRLAAVNLRDFLERSRLLPARR